MENKEYILIESEKVMEIGYEALRKLGANKERPLSEANIEAKAVLNVVNYLFKNNKYKNEIDERNKQ